MINTLDFSTARTIATSLIHSKLDCCNSFFLNLPQSQLGHLQLILSAFLTVLTKFFNQNNLLISTAFSMFNLNILLAPLTSSLSNVHQFAYVSKLLTGLLPTMLLYFGILYPNNCGNLRLLHH